MTQHSAKSQNAQTLPDAALVSYGKGTLPMWKEFREFAMRPTLIEVAIGLVMALALAALVGSLVDHIVMPIVGIIFGEPSFNHVMVLTIND